MSLPDLFNASREKWSHSSSRSEKTLSGPMCSQLSKLKKDCILHLQDKGLGWLLCPGMSNSCQEIWSRTFQHFVSFWRIFRQGLKVKLIRIEEVKDIKCISSINTESKTPSPVMLVGLRIFDFSIRLGFCIITKSCLMVSIYWIVYELFGPQTLSFLIVLTGWFGWSNRFLKATFHL